MTLGITVPIAAALNPLPKKYRVKVLVIRNDGRELTDDEMATIRATLQESSIAASARKKTARSRVKKAPASASNPPPTPKRAAARRPAR